MEIREELFPKAASEKKNNVIKWAFLAMLVI